MTHNQLQKLCWEYLWNYFPESRYTCWHTKNEDIPHKSESKKDYIIRRSQDKAIGLLPGVYDLVFYRQGVLHIFDIKVGHDKLSENQIRFKDQIIKQGGRAYEIRTLEEFQQIIQEIYGS